LTATAGRILKPSVARVHTLTATFQAGHASSILVTRSRASLLVNAGFNVPKLFEYGDDKKNQAGHLYFMIIGVISLRALSGGIS
jgi:hypothetical protein